MDKATKQGELLSAGQLMCNEEEHRPKQHTWCSANEAADDGRRPNKLSTYDDKEA